MADPRDQSFRTRFLDDYIAECEEHLAALRRTMVTLDGYLGTGLPAAVVEELFRRFHSLKGISGMVEFREAEALAHELESYLRALQKGHTQLGVEGVQALIDGSRAFDHLLETFRKQEPAPDLTRLLQRLAALAGAEPSALRSARRDVETYLVSFTPRPELQERGVTVNTVRQRLEAAGEILEVTPQVSAGGGVRFDFILRGAIDDATLENWAKDGLTHSVVAAPSDAVGPDPSPAPASSSSGPTGRSHYVRVDLTRLDDLMRMIAEVVITRARLQTALARVESILPAGEWRAIQEQGNAIERHVRDLRDGVMRIRLVPIGEINRSGQEGCWWAREINVITIADDYDAMVSDGPERAYKPENFTPKDAVTLLRKGVERGRYEPRMTEIFISDVLGL